ncbi:hypothetical protein FHR81_004056 [Actinoalloteichus hoggarensis]|uniref:hypothetical protein n=1 Tax=Actinoalloteichus hoggarensis TaxID=1470176 RepID=UPI000B8B49BB|nr:hypothetical protein [Actinoalloteichus hoggarensis]MBB5922989.1 hypothetical protein [Actinoalloteichus hoggarensis]
MAVARRPVLLGYVGSTPDHHEDHHESEQRQAGDEQIDGEFVRAADHAAPTPSTVSEWVERPSPRG